MKTKIAGLFRQKIKTRLEAIQAGLNRFRQETFVWLLDHSAIAARFYRRTRRRRLATLKARLARLYRRRIRPAVETVRGWPVAYGRWAALLLIGLAAAFGLSRLWRRSTPLHRRALALTAALTGLVAGYWKLLTGGLRRQTPSPATAPAAPKRRQKRPVRA